MGGVNTSCGIRSRALMTGRSQDGWIYIYISAYYTTAFKLKDMWFTEKTIA